MTAVINTPTALQAVVSSSTAMTAIAASATAMSALENSATAYNALKSSPLLVRYNPVDQNAWRDDTVRNGAGILVRLVSFQNNGNWYKLDNGTQVTLSTGDSKVVKAFRTSLLVHWVCYSAAERGVYYIPC